MIGHAVRERCPRCRMILGTTAVQPGQTVLRQIQCHSRQCRREPMLSFFVRDGKVEYLTREQVDALRLAPPLGGGSSGGSSDASSDNGGANSGKA